MNDRTETLATLVVVGLLVVAVPAGTVSAEQAYVDRLFGLDDDEDGSTIGTMLAGAQGQVDSMQMGSVLSSPDPEAKMDALAAWYNNRSGVFASYANQQIDDPTGAHNVINVTYIVDGESETKYLIIPIKDGEYQPGTMQDSLSPPGAESYVKVSEDRYLVNYDDGSTRTREQVRYEVDDTIVVRNKGVAEINADLQTLYQRYISESEDVERAFAKRLGAKYNGELETTLIGGDNAS